ncbi:ATP-binding protein [Hyalangium minutum]|uniref:histidine kinase n=1 Tax=Hyalangium minutum TaxID=394096 RepID=A0A085WLH0_9BACT|nr:ATP-binding protein [Hyalangium minutum]KFE68533.1 PAS/PAC sensor hybrid histidine kinase [Hyalangium minutum]
MEVRPEAELTGFSAMDALEALEDGFLALDASLKVCAANRAAEQLLTLSRSGLCGQALSTVLGEPGASAALLEGCQRALSEQVPTRLVEHRASAGQWLEIRLRPQRGQVWLFLRDVTWEHRTEERLRDFERQQAVLRYVIANVPHAIFWKDREGRFLGANQNFVSDSGAGTVENLIGKTDYDIWKREEADFFVQVDRQVMQSGTPMLDIEEPVRRADGSERTLLTSKVPLRDEAGQVMGMLGIYADITERKRGEREVQKAKDAAEAAVRAKSEFLTVMSHELRTPLTLILGPLGVVLSDASGELPEHVRRELERIHRNAERLFRLVDDILDHQKVEAGRMEVHWEPAEIASLTEQLVEDARSAGAIRGVEVRFEADAHLGVVPLDRRKFEKIVLNLLGNALKFTPSGGSIVAALRARDSWVELSVTDTGPGIPESKQGLLFQRFQQLDGSTTRKHEGTGMGLAIVKEFAELMGGEVAVESKPGEGSRFIVRLPRSADRLVEPALSTGRTPGSRAGYFTPAPLPMGSPVPAPERQPQEAPRLLIADDNPDMRAYLASLLGREYALELVENGRQALEAMERQRPDVIVSDVMMPEMDGAELVSRLKASPTYRDIPIVLLTAKASRQEAIEGLEIGADDYLSKPFSAAELQARVRAAVRMHSLYQELQARKHELEEALRRLRATQEQLLQKGKMAAVGSLVSGLCHELNNPMAAIRMSLDLMVRRKLAPERQRETLEVIERQSQRCVSLVKALREFSSRPAVIREPCEVGAVVGRVIELVGPQLSRRRLSLDARLAAAELPRLHLHGAELETALRHVVTNALEASPEGGTVTLEARPLAREGTQGVEVAVIDHGPGISPDTLPHVIEPFFTTKPPGEGTGLGLSLTHRFIDAHGGTLNIESERGRGTTVRMWLPAAPVLETAASAEGEAPLQ